VKKVALVTGALSGNGLSIVNRFLIVEYKVIALDLDGAAIEKLSKSQWKKYKKKLLCIQANFSNEKDSQKMIN
jgi:NADP-dependent 3-hydroxy acid dehydrogenase YdfG